MGQSVKISVSAAGTQPFTYQWYKNSVVIAGATAADYTISPVTTVTTAGADQYYATVANSAGTVDSEIANLTVIPADPTITTQPTAQVVTAGRSASFSVVASGSGTLSYQWTKNGSNIIGATAATYTIANTVSGDAGNYAVVVTNIVSSVPSNPVASSAASLTVNAAPVGPSITTQPTAKTVTAGQSASFAVVATGSGSLAYQWTKNGSNISGATAATYTITSTVSGDAGNYAVVVTNSVSSVTSTAVSLTVNAAPVGPSITTQPTAKTVTAGQSASFTVVATGSGSLAYQWTKNGSNISGAAAATYTIASTVNGDAGNYAVVVTNSVSSVTSSAVSLTVNAAPVGPSITTQPTAKTVTAGQSASFTVVATGSGTLSYQWTKNGSNISGATAATYTIASTVNGDAGSYAVVVTNSVSSVTSTAVSLTLTPAAPTITTQPAAQSVTVGQAASFAVVASGSGTVNYQWKKNGTNISGATAATYSISNTVSGDAGSYAVVITNTVGSLTSTAVTSIAVSLTVNAAPVGPSITTQPTAKSITVGQAATFTVTATGSGTLSYQWTKNGSNISGATTATYTIASTVSGDAGNYAVIVTNAVSSVTSSSVSLTVNAAPVGPTITTQPTAQSVTVGQSVSFTVAATGSGTLSYQWKKNGTNISGATSVTYTIASPVSGDAGNYSVAVTNSVSSVTSVSVSLTVNAAPVGPTITTQPTAQSVTVGQSVSFTVAATGSGTLSYQWKKNGTNISGATSATYTIASPTSGDAGNYSVVVTNAVSSVTSTSVGLTVSAAPVGPTITTQPTAQSVAVGQSASFTVTATGSGTLSYQWTKNGSNISGAISATYTIASATSSDAGSYAVVVTNSVSSVTSNAATLAVTIGSVVANPDGSAATTTGGAAGQTVTASTAADLRTYAESTTPYVINVSGVINLGGSVSVKSNKTIQGFDANTTIIGCLDLSSGGVNNVIIRGLNITNPGTTISNGAYTDGGDGLKIRNATNIFVTHCSLFDCAGDLVEISTGSDNITVSWSEFYYTAAQTVHRSAMIAGLAGTETKPLHITLHHNWWSDSCDVNMPSGTYGYVHLYNNYFKAPGNTSATDALDYAQFFAERNVFEQINDPLYKENLVTSAPAGRIRSIGNQFISCTGKAADAGTDAVFTPLYSYELLIAADVATVTAQLSGNTAGASSATPTGSTASISGPTDAVTPSSSFTLTAVPSGFTGVSYQWRLNNFDIPGATSSTYAVTSAQSGNAGIYTVVIGLAAGDSVVSSPLTITLGTASGSTGGGSSSSSGGSPASSTSGGGGGGAPSVWYLALIGALAVARARKKLFAR